MTWKQIEALRKSLPIHYCDMTDEQYKLDKEIWCREMINSCLIYWTNFLNSHYKDKHIKELWEERVKELYEEQLKDFKQAIVSHCVGVDWEGCTYNSIKWADEI